MFYSKHGRSNLALILVTVGIVILVGVGLLIFKPWSKEEDSSAGGADNGKGVTPSISEILKPVSRPVGANFKTLEQNLAEIGISGTFHVEYPDWPTATSKIIPPRENFITVKKADECTIEIGWTTVPGASTVDGAWQEMKESLQQPPAGVTIVRADFDETKNICIVEIKDMSGEMAGEPRHFLIMFIFLKEGGKIVAPCVVIYTRPDKWSEYEDIVRYVLSTAKVVEGGIQKSSGDEEYPSPKYSSPEKTIETFIKAAKAGDIEAYLDCLTKESREYFENMISQNPGAFTSESLKESAKAMELDLAKAKVLEKTEDTAKMGIEGQSQTLDFKKENGNWKVDMMSIL